MQLVKPMNHNTDSLPAIKLIPLDNESPLNIQRIRSAKSTKTALPTDIRWVKVLEFLRSTNLSSNSRKLYERELKRFLGWTQTALSRVAPTSPCAI